MQKFLPNKYKKHDQEYLYKYTVIIYLLFFSTSGDLLGDPLDDILTPTVAPSTSTSQMIPPSVAPLQPITKKPTTPPDDDDDDDDDLDLDLDGMNIDDNIDTSVS